MSLITKIIFTIFIFLVGIEVGSKYSEPAKVIETVLSERKDACEVLGGKYNYRYSEIFESYREECYIVKSEIVDF